jgi:O-antigen/teichoic acid export membrane protein
LGVIQRQSIINSIISFAGILLGALNTIVFLPIFLPKEELGLTRLLFSYAALIATFVPLGVNNILLKYFPVFRNKEKQHHGIFGLAVGLTLFGFLIASFTLFAFKPFVVAQYNRNSPLFNDYFNYIFPLTFFIAFSGVFFTYCTSLFKTNFPSFLNDVLVRILAIVLFGIYYLKWITLPQMIMLYVLKYALIMLLNLVYILKIDRPSLWLNLKFFLQQNPKQILAYGLLLSFTSLSSLGLKYIDLVMLGKYLPLDYVGIYGVAIYIPTVIEAPLFALHKIGVASIAEAWKRNDLEEVKKIYFRSSRYLLIIGGFLFLCVNLNTHSLFELFPDKGYSLGESVVLIISIGTVVSMATGINDAIIYTSDKYIYGAAMLLILFAVAVINNYIFIPLWGMDGAAFATAFSAVFFNAMKYVFIWKKFHLQPFDQKTLLIILIIAICFGVGWLLPNWGHPIFQIAYRTTIVGLAFLALLKLLSIVPELEDELWNYMRKKKILQ